MPVPDIRYAEAVKLVVTDATRQRLGTLLQQLRRSTAKDEERRGPPWAVGQHPKHRKQVRRRHPRGPPPRTRLIREDVAGLERLHDLGHLELLMLRLPDLAGSPLSINAVREDLQVAHKTVANWLEILKRLSAIDDAPVAPGLRYLKGRCDGRPRCGKSPSRRSGGARLARGTGPSCVHSRCRTWHFYCF